MIHKPVMAEETMKYLKPKKSGTYIDATLNGGGHAKMLLEALGSSGTLLGIERDHDLVAAMREKKLKGLVVEEGNYTDIKDFASAHKLKNIAGILFDFGFSSWHTDKSKRGFSFQKDEILDMRYSVHDAPSAAELVNMLSERELTDIFLTYGEESYARHIARAIVTARKKKRIFYTRELTDIISQVVTHRGKTHPATRVFQALRIAVNHELDAVRVGIREAMALVAPYGRVVAISYHSLEDRIVKKEFSAFGNVITKKPIAPQRAEILNNPRARSAKLRAWEKTI